MFQDNKNKLIPRGDYVNAEEALMDDEWEIRSRCESVHDVVSKKIIPLPKALKAYNVTLEQYFGYLMMKNLKVKISMDAIIIGSLVKIVLGFMDTSNTKLDDHTKKLLEDMHQLSTVS